MSYDPLKLSKEKDGKYIVQPEVMYPATIARIKEILAGEGGHPVEIMTPGWERHPLREPVLVRFLEEAEEFPEGAFDKALEPYDEKKPDPVRSAALAYAKSYFERALVLKVGHSVVLHYEKNLDYRR